MLRKSLREITPMNFSALYCSDCKLHFCIDNDRDENEVVFCSYCGRKFRLQTTYTEVC